MLNCKVKTPKTLPNVLQNTFIKLKLKLEKFRRGKEIERADFLGLNTSPSAAIPFLFSKLGYKQTWNQGSSCWASWPHMGLHGCGLGSHGRWQDMGPRGCQTGQNFGTILKQFSAFEMTESEDGFNRNILALQVFFPMQKESHQSEF